MKTEIETKMAEKTKPVCETMEKMVSAFKSKLDEGIENIDTEEAYKVADIIKDMSEAYKNISKALYYETVSAAMEKSESGEDEEMEDGEQKFYTRRLRDSRGRYMSRRYTDMGMDERYYSPNRDMDRESMGRMYYSQGGSSSSNGDGNMSRDYHDGMMRDYREGTSGMSRKTYVENPSKQNLEKHIDDIGNDVKELIQNTTPENKVMVKNKLIALANAM